MTPEFFRQGTLSEGIGYQQYRALFEAEVEAHRQGSQDPRLVTYGDYITLNWQRSLRVEKTFEPSEEARRAMESIAEEQTWMVLTESWCGDSAQTLPVLHRLASLSPKVRFVIMQRDTHSDIMDLYLTAGARAIPKLVAFNADGEELFRWGARPAAAQALVEEHKQNNTPREEMYAAVHLWYAKDHGRSTEAELAALVVSALPQ